jgi:hypothetical protein
MVVFILCRGRGAYSGRRRGGQGIMPGDIGDIMLVHLCDQRIVPVYHYQVGTGSVHPIYPTIEAFFAATEFEHY